jgi:hypothetical protein
MKHHLNWKSALLFATSISGIFFMFATNSKADPTDVPNASFALTGHIEKFTLSTPVTQFSPATITVRGIDVLLPSNIQVVMPGQYLTPEQLFRNQGTTWLGSTGAPGSGLALTDKFVTPPASVNDMPTRIPFEAEIIGNIVGTQYVAGVIHISQGALHAGAGFIQDISASTGELRVGPKGRTDGARVVLNDPEGIYGPSNSAPEKAFMKLDDRFALDSGNSPVHGHTGFPVCVPVTSNTATCPPGNRPTVINPLRFTCGPVSAANTLPFHAGCDPTKPIPLAVGDYITYLGMLSEGPASAVDSTKVFRIASHSIEAEMGVYTSPGANPAYVFIEEALQGTLGERYTDFAATPTNPLTLIPSEETTRFRIVGFTSDPSRNIEVSIFDENIANAEGSGTPPIHPGGFAILSPEIGMPTTTGGQLGRFRGTWPSKDDARAVRREAKARILNAPNTPAPEVAGLG